MIEPTEIVLVTVLWESRLADLTVFTSEKNIYFQLQNITPPLILEQILTIVIGFIFLYCHGIKRYSFMVVNLINLEDSEKDKTEPDFFQEQNIAEASPEKQHCKEFIAMPEFLDLQNEALQCESLSRSFPFVNSSRPMHAFSCL